LLHACGSQLLLFYAGRAAPAASTSAVLLEQQLLLLLSCALPNGAASPQSSCLACTCSVNYSIA
jgi:hypothetical protein